MESCMVESINAFWTAASFVVGVGIFWFYVSRSIKAYDMGAFGYLALGLVCALLSIPSGIAVRHAQNGLRYIASRETHECIYVADGAIHLKRKSEHD